MFACAEDVIRGGPLVVCFGLKPPGWVVDDVRGDGARWVNVKRRLVVIASVAVELDGCRWLHLSISHAKRMARYEELCYLKRHWAGTAAKAVEVHASAEEHVNLNPRVRHLWVCLDGDPLPDFTHGGRSI
jgi:hypothetical protein